MSAEQQDSLAAELRMEIDSHYDHVFAEATGRGMDARIANELALFRAASVALTGQQIPASALEKDIQMETVPFNNLPVDQAKAGFREYVMSKYFPERADLQTLSHALRTFSDDVFKRSASVEDPDMHIYMAIYKQKYDWQKIIANDIRQRLASGDLGVS